MWGGREIEIKVEILTGDHAGPDHRSQYLIYLNDLVYIPRALWTFTQ